MWGPIRVPALSANSERSRNALVTFPPQTQDLPILAYGEANPRHPVPFPHRKRELVCQDYHAVINDRQSWSVKLRSVSPSLCLSPTKRVEKWPTKGAVPTVKADLHHEQHFRITRQGPQVIRHQMLQFVGGFAHPGHQRHHVIGDEFGLFR